MAKRDEASTALVPVNERYMALANMSALAVIRENLGTESLTVRDLEQVKVPTGGGKFFQVGDEAAATVSGIILSSTYQRAYWRTSFDESGGGSPPDCSSPDGQFGQGDPGGDCMSCRFAQFGSAAKGKGQACRAFRVIFLLTSGSPLPLVLVIPPTSLQNYKDYVVKKLGNLNVRPTACETEFALEQDKSDDGITYSKIKPKLVRPLEPAEVDAANAYTAGIMPYIQRARAQVTQQGGI